MHPIQSRDAGALEKMQNLALEFVKVLRHASNEAVLQQLRLFSLTQRWIRGGFVFLIAPQAFWNFP